MSNWDNCDHEWHEKIDSQFHSENKTDVSCTKCGCPGERDTKTGNVFWPAT
ncbi:hypothetical protein LCGC14_1770950 [marine sediment metagenome]|uniref:Uncharacterized protein n=1 Tax=marine sediment metagenome TaxID=412755 RepID=A0A0F9GYB9_9ZZZZ